MVTTDDFIEWCIEEYLANDLIPEKGGEWEAAHHPIPECLGGTETVLLLKQHHAIHNILQSEELFHPCVWGWEKEYLTGEWERLLPFYYFWKQWLGMINGQKGDREAKRQNGLRAKEEKTGIHAPGVAVEAGRLGGLAHSRDHLQAAGRLGGPKGAEAQNKIKWQNTDKRFPAYVSTSAGLSHWQRARGIDTSNRVRVS